MRKPIVAGNWKMHGSSTSSEALLTTLKQHAQTVEAELIIFPPFVYLPLSQALLSGSPISWGAQNICEHEEQGAYTGEISARMLLEFGCRYVLVGHSERRQLYCESNQLIAAKFKTAVNAGLIPILCVGETETQRQQGLTQEIIATQITTVLESCPTRAAWENAVIAYEPVWAIGTGQQATPEQAQTVHALIRKLVDDYQKGLGNTFSILYGGSVKANNVFDIMEMPDVDGVLVGGASLQAEEFLKIGRLCSGSYVAKT